MLVGLLSSWTLLLALLGVEACVQTKRKREGPSRAPYERRGASSNAKHFPRRTEEHGSKTVFKLALSVLREYNHNDPRSVYKCLASLVRSRSLKPWFAGIAKQIKDWKDRLETSRVTPSVSSLNGYYERLYNHFAGAFEGALDQFCGSMEPSFFPGFDDAEEAADKQSSVGSLMKTVMWRDDDVDARKDKYNYAVHAVYALARDIKGDLLKYMERNPDLGWERLVDLKDKLVEDYGTTHEETIDSISENTRDINDLMLHYLSQNDDRRWSLLIGKLDPFLKYEPLPDTKTYFFNGLEDLAVHIVEHVRERRAKGLQGDNKALFKMDIGFAVSLNEEMEMLMRENVLGCDGIRYQPWESDESYESDKSAESDSD